MKLGWHGIFSSFKNFLMYLLQIAVDERHYYTVIIICLFILIFVSTIQQATPMFKC